MTSFINLNSINNFPLKIYGSDAQESE